MDYQTLLSELEALAEEKLRDFNAKLMGNPEVKLLGVRIPTLRKLAKKYKAEYAEMLTFPDEYFEVTLVKGIALGLQKYEVFLANFKKILPHINNWALCDCFDVPCVKSHREEFAEVIKELRFSEHEFTSRFALVQLLRYYCTEEYLPLIFESVEGCNHEKYYVSMAAAWLLAEVLIKHYESGVIFLKKETLPAATHNRAIQKVRESFRLTAEQKEELKTLKKQK